MKALKTPLFGVKMRPERTIFSLLSIDNVEWAGQ
jgi:hypothetical protein